MKLLLTGTTVPLGVARHRRFLPAIAVCYGNLVAVGVRSNRVETPVNLAYRVVL